MDESQDEELPVDGMILKDAFTVVYPPPPPPPRRVRISALPLVSMTIVVVLPLFIVLTHKYWLPLELFLFGSVALPVTLAAIYHVARRWSLYAGGQVVRACVTGVERVGKSAVRISYSFNVNAKHYFGDYFGIRQTAPSVSANVWVIYDHTNPARSMIVPATY